MVYGRCVVKLARNSPYPIIHTLLQWHCTASPIEVESISPPSEFGLCGQKDFSKHDTTTGLKSASGAGFAFSCCFAEPYHHTV